MRWLEESRLESADILSTGLAALQPSPAAPVAASFRDAQADLWRTPASGTLSLSLDGATAVGAVQLGWSALTVVWRNSGGAQLSSSVISQPRPVQVLEFSGGGTPASVDITFTGAASVFRLVRGAVQSIDAIISPSSVPPSTGLHPDFENETLASDRNVFLGRTGTKSGELASLDLRLVRRNDAAFRMRERLIEGDIIITMPVSGSFSGESFYCWADGIIARPELESAARWRLILPLRYWSE